MNLYLIELGDKVYYVEAGSMQDAINNWRRYRIVTLGWDDADFEPESVYLIHDQPVIR